MKHKYISLVATFIFVATLSATASNTRLTWRERREVIKAHRESLNSSSGSKVTLINAPQPTAIADSTKTHKVKTEEPTLRQVETSTYNDSLTVEYSGVQIDSLLSEWRERAAVDQFNNFFDNFIMVNDAVGQIDIKSTPDSILSRRLMDLASPINLPYNSIINSYISRYTNARYGTIGRIMSLSQYYFPKIEEELIKNGLPVELRIMPVIESALASTATSRMGAKGLWQFMAATGKSYGLEINSLVDERCDPEASTIAACKFMRDLYNIYNDWSLAIAAYNCGPGNVNKALARAGLKRGSFWDVYEFLPHETRGYVPAFIGATYAYAYHQLHNIKFQEPPLPLATDTIRVNKLMHLGQVAEVLELPIQSLRDLNPQYTKDIIPATTKEYTLRLPQRYVVKYIENEAAIHAKDSTYLKQYIDPEIVRKAQRATESKIHVVRNGENLGSIARKYRVTVRQIMTWNGLKNANKLSVGQRLKIVSR